MMCPVEWASEMSGPRKRRALPTSSQRRRPADSLPIRDFAERRQRNVVLRVIYQMTETQFKRFWVAKIFRAEAASPPKIAYSNDLQYELVAAMPGAIAFVDADDVRPGLKVLRVDGHLPGDRDYPLR
jgi:hypothetical protein